MAVEQQRHVARAELGFASNELTAEVQHIRASQRTLR
jgi:hypothetical protein